MIYKHKKSGRLYTVVSMNVINGTNKDDGTIMVLYTGMKRDGSGHGQFVRELNEFNEKFEPTTDPSEKTDNIINNVMLVFMTALYFLLGGAILNGEIELVIKSGSGWLHLMGIGAMIAFGYWWLYTEIHVNKYFTKGASK